MSGQDNLTDQMLDLAVIARRLRMFYAETYIREHFYTSPSEVTMIEPSKKVGVGAICGLPGRSGVCIRPPKHHQRHRYGTPGVAHIKPDRAWEKLQIYKPEGSRFSLLAGNPCRVKGERGTWRIIALEKHRENHKVNVEVKQDRNGHSRVFPVEKIVYMRPKKVAM